jgi:DNA-binding helix-hairpin-helix protein with protein kinase domain
VHAAFKDAFQDAGMNGPVEIPMQYLVFAVQILLDTFSERDEPEFRPSAANWRAAVDESGFVDGEREMRFGETFRGGR